MPVAYDAMLMICEHDALNILYFMVVAPLTNIDVWQTSFSQIAINISEAENRSGPSFKQSRKISMQY